MTRKKEEKEEANPKPTISTETWTEWQNDPFLDLLLPFFSDGACSFFLKEEEEERKEGRKEERKDIWQERRSYLQRMKMCLKRCLLPPVISLSLLDMAPLSTCLAASLFFSQVSYFLIVQVCSAQLHVRPMREKGVGKLRGGRGK